MASRKETEDFIIKYINKIIPDGINKKNYEEFFSGMTNSEFAKFIDDLETGQRYLPIIVPNFSKTKLKVERNLEVAKELGFSFFKRIWVEGKNGLPPYLLPIEHMVIDLPCRRASQLLIKKRKIPDNTKSIDTMTGQPTGDSKGATLTLPELYLVSAMGLDNCAIELMKYRGGDNKGIVAFNAFLSNNGSVSLKNLKQYSSGVESTNTLRTLLTCMMIKNNL